MKKLAHLFGVKFKPTPKKQQIRIVQGKHFAHSTALGVRASVRHDVKWFFLRQSELRFVEQRTRFELEMEILYEGSS